MSAAQSLLEKEMRSYLKAVPAQSRHEISQLHEWIMQGNSPYDNPWYTADADGIPLDFIHALRTEYERSQTANAEFVGPTVHTSDSDPY